MTPRVIDELTPWEFDACVNGWNACHGGAPAIEAPSDEDFEALKEQDAQRALLN
jgi:hypothetical protein